MKRLIFCAIFFFNILPTWNNDGISICNLNIISAQNGQTLLIQWLQTQYPGANSIQNAPNSTSTVFVHVDNNTVIAYNVNYILVNNIGAIHGYYEPGHSNNISPTPPPAPTPSNTNATTAGQNEQNEQEWIEFNIWMSALNMQYMQEQEQQYQEWLLENSNGWESTSGPYQCPGEGSYGVASWYEYTTALSVGSNDNSNCVPIPSGLPCFNRFLYGSKIISFSASQQSAISCYFLSDAALNSVVINSQRYSMPILYDVIIESRSIEVIDGCGVKITVETEDKNFVNPKSKIKFTNFDALNSSNPLPSGITKISGKNAQGQTVVGFTDVPDNLSGFTFSLDESNIINAAVGDQVLALKKSINNSPPQWYCLTLMEEDIQRGLDRKRDKKYIPETIDLEHPVNLPVWVRELLDLFPDIILGECTVNYINQKLDDLHQSPSYLALPTENDKRNAEYRSLAYDLVFGYFYCQTDENAAKNMSCTGQFAMAMLHELIASVDIDQMKEGLIKIAQGLGGLVQQNVNNLIDAVKDASENETTIGTFDYERFVRSITENTIQDAQSFYDKAVTIATQFKNVYFTNCNATPLAGGSYDMCCYRNGELTMMVLPILLTAGDYAVVKLTGLASKYGIFADKAVKMLADAERLSAHIAQDGAKLVIKESDEPGAFIISTQEKIGDDVIIVGEQNLDNVIKDGDLIEEFKSPQTPPINTIINESPGNKTDKWNKALNKPLQPLKEYHVGDHIYKTDHLGRVTEVRCDNLQKITHDRNTYQQSVKCNKIKNGQPGDQGGHLIGSQFNGPGEQINVVPMKSSINQPPGTYAAMEQEWSGAITNGGTVTNVRINITYGSNNRPTGITVSADITDINGNVNSNVWQHSNL